MRLPTIDTQPTAAREARAGRPTVTAGAAARPPARDTLSAAMVAQVALLMVLSLLDGLGPLGWLAAIGYTAAVCLGLDAGVRRAGATSLGPADTVTLLRSTLVGCVAALVADTVHQPAPVALVFWLTLVALALDGVDGQVARRTGTASALGARFDMEVDAFLILVLSCYVAVHLGPWVLAIGLMRYAFVAAGRPLAWLRAPIPPTIVGKVVAALQGVVLMVAVTGVLAPVVATGVVAAALAALVWSFSRSVWWLYRNRPGWVRTSLVRVDARRWRAA